MKWIVHNVGPLMYSPCCDTNSGCEYITRASSHPLRMLTAPLAHISHSRTLTRAAFDCRGEGRAPGQRRVGGAGGVQPPRLIAPPPSASACTAGSLPSHHLIDVLRIRFCHLKTHRGDTPRTFSGPRQGGSPGGIWRATMGSLSVSAPYAWLLLQWTLTNAVSGLQE